MRAFAYCVACLALASFQATGVHDLKVFPFFPMSFFLPGWAACPTVKGANNDAGEEVSEGWLWAKQHKMLDMVRLASCALGFCMRPRPRCCAGLFSCCFRLLGALLQRCWCAGVHQRNGIQEVSGYPCFVAFGQVAATMHPFQDPAKDSVKV